MQLDDDNDDSDLLEEQLDIQPAQAEYIVDAIGNGTIDISYSGSGLGPFIENDEADELGINDLRATWCSDEEIAKRVSIMTMRSLPALNELGIRGDICDGEFIPDHNEYTA